MNMNPFHPHPQIWKSQAEELVQAEQATPQERRVR